MKIEHNLQPQDKVKIKFRDSNDEYIICTIISIYNIGNNYEIQFSYNIGNREYKKIVDEEIFREIFRWLSF